MPQHTPKRDFRQEVTDQILADIEHDDLPPWRKPWVAGGLKTLFNTTSLNPYHGGNAIWLIAQAIRLGYDDPRWLTFNQAKEKGW